VGGGYQHAELNINLEIVAKCLAFVCVYGMCLQWMELFHVSKHEIQCLSIFQPSFNLACRRVC